MPEILGGQLMVFVLAVCGGVLFRFIGLPSLVGQVGAGVLVGISGWLGRGDVELLRSMGDFGVALLLFLVGLEMNWRELKQMGRKSLFFFGGQTLSVIAVLAAVGNVVFGLPFDKAILLSMALSFSSTIVVVKTLSEKKNLASFAGRLSLAVLLLQDVLAILLLVLLPGMGQATDLSAFWLLIVKMIVLFVAVDVVGHYLIGVLFRRVIRHGEDLILFSLAWFFVVIFLSERLGIAVTIGSFLAGLSLSTTWGHFQIVSKVKILRDIFLTLFFVVLGIQVGVKGVNWLAVFWLSVAVVIGKFWLSYVWGVLMGFGGRVAFLIGVNMTQVSEFSLVIAGLGIRSSLWGDEVASSVMVTGLITMTLSTVLIGSAEKLYLFMRDKFKSVFGAGYQREVGHVTLKDHVILLGADRTGMSVVNFLTRRKVPYLVVDFNPDVVRKITNMGGKAVFSDATDPDVVEVANMPEARLIISTIKDKNDSLALLTELKRREIKTPVIVDAESTSEAKELYNAGASYVVLPHFVSGYHVSQLVRRSIKDSHVLAKMKERQGEVIKAYEG